MFKSQAYSKIYEVAQSPDLLSEPEHVHLHKLLTESGMVVRFDGPLSLLTEPSSPRYIGNSYAWTIPALADYIYELSTSNIARALLRQKTSLKL